MESVKLSVQTDHTFFMRASIFCHCVTNVKTLIYVCSYLLAHWYRWNVVGFSRTELEKVRSRILNLQRTAGATDYCENNVCKIDPNTLLGAAHSRIHSHTAPTYTHMHTHGHTCTDMHTHAHTSTHTTRHVRKHTQTSTHTHPPMPHMYKARSQCYGFLASRQAMCACRT